MRFYHRRRHPYSSSSTPKKLALGSGWTARSAESVGQASWSGRSVANGQMPTPGLPARVKSVGDLVRTVSCSAHIDAGPTTKRKSTTCISWTSMLAEGPEKEVQFLIGSYIKAAPGGDHQAWEAVVADFDAMSTGVVGGREIARDGRRLWKLMLLVVKADEEVRCNTFGLSHWASSQCCSECLADNNPAGRPYTDLRPGAAWRATEGMTFGAYAARLTRPLHPSAACHYFCHLMDCKGCYCHRGMQPLGEVILRRA